MRFFSRRKGVIPDMVSIPQPQDAVCAKMRSAIGLWERMFAGQAPWLDDTTRSLELPAAIAAEVARLTTVELESAVEGDGERAVFLQNEYSRVLDNLTNIVEYACAGGGVILKPCCDGTSISVDAVEAWRFVPTGFNSRRELTGAVFSEQLVKGREVFTRLERHELSEAGYRIRNEAYRSHTRGQLGRPCPLSAVDEWAEMESETLLCYRDGSVPERMLFAYFRLPLANAVDPESPLGVSVYSRATGLIEQADKQYSRILWEYEGSELAIDASYGALRTPSENGSPMRLPERQKRLFRQLALDHGQNGDLYEVFSPAIRDQSLFNGLDKLLKRIEFNCCLAYGTLSDPQNTDKTAEEIRAGKQRSYAMVCAMQKELQKTLEQLVWAMDFYTSLYALAPAGDYALRFAWGDGILEDADKEFAHRAQMVEQGILKPEKLLSWYFGVSEEQALEMLPEIKGGAL